MTDRPIEWAVLRCVWRRKAMGLDGLEQIRLDDLCAALCQTFRDDSVRRCVSALSRSTNERGPLLIWSHDWVGITEDGEAACTGANAHPQFLLSTREWESEALTGITTQGRRSKITWAAMPSARDEEQGIENGDGQYLLDSFGVLEVGSDPMTRIVEHRRCPDCDAILKIEKFRIGCSVCLSCESVNRKANND